MDVATTKPNRVEVREYSYGDDPKMKGKYLLEEFYKPSEDVLRHIYSVYDKYIKWRALKEMNYKWFNNQTINDYLDESRKKFWGYIPLSADTDTPQFFFPETRNQIIGILSKIANLRMKPTFDGVEGFDQVKATVMNDLFEYWRRGSNRKMQNFWQYLYCIINGTVIVFTGYNSKVRTVKDITMHDPETGKTEYKEERLDESEVEDVVVNLEDFFFPKLWVPANQLQDQDEVIWRTLVKWSDFKDAFKGYSNADLVAPGSQFADSSIFADFLSYDVRGSDFVEVIKYFNAPLDQYSIIANGVLLNPLKNKDDEDEIAPLPWNHKKLPFSGTMFEPLDATFFFGMSLSQKVKSPQDALNKLWELMLDREQRAVAAPIITTDPSVELGLEFKAGRIYQVQADVNQYKEMQMAPSSSSYWQALSALQGIVSATGAGGTMGQNTTATVQPQSATQNDNSEQQKKETLGLYSMFYQDLLEQKVWITIMNMIQFYTAKKVEKILGDRKFYKVLSMSDARMFGGGIGNREIRICDQPLKPSELKQEMYLRSLLKKERVEIIEVTPKGLRQLKFDLKIKFEPENSPEAERALFLDYLTTAWKLFGQTGILSAKKSLYRMAEKFNEPISDIVDDSVVADYEKDRFGITNQTEEQKQQQAQQNAQSQQAAGGAGPTGGGAAPGGGSPQPMGQPGAGGGQPGQPSPGGAMPGQPGQPPMSAPPQQPAVAGIQQRLRGRRFGSQGPMGK